MKLPVRIFLIMFSGLLLTGCGLQSTDETSHPLFKLAIKAQKANDIKQAVKYFNRFLSVRPESSKTHLLLASIYDENLDKPLDAVYHYECFLGLAPDSPEAANVKKWLEAARRRYYFQMRLKYNDPEDVSSLQNTLYTTENELKKAKLEAERQKLELGKLKSLQKRLILYARKTETEKKELNAKLINLQNSHQETLAELTKDRLKLKEMLAEKENKEVKKEEPKPEAKAEIKPLEKPDKETKTDKDEKTDKDVKAADRETKTDKDIKTGTVQKEAAVPEPPKEENKIVKPLEKPEAETTTPTVAATIPKAPLSPPPFTLKTVETPKAKTDSEYQLYTVKRGDSLSSISRQFYGSARYYKLIFDANRAISPYGKSLNARTGFKNTPKYQRMNYRALHLRVLKVL